MSNSLARETSPYLLQHAANPVDWYPWGEEALTRARMENKPVLLSIGYSACHWCHVMAHESFENENIARIMNRNFINIKVDREERPDLDAVFMEAVQSMTGSGGWPLTVFLTPDCKPFFGGIYFPPEDRHGMPGFARILEAVTEAYHSRRSEIEQASRQIEAALKVKTGQQQYQEPPSADILDRAYLALKSDFDITNGGFGSAPKFPQAMVLEFLLRYYLRTRDVDALTMVTLTLEKMAAGGIYDQIGSGFHRYSTDSRWLVPHFEKMLYDSALLIRVYLHAFLVTGNRLFRRIAEENTDFVLREMTGREGGFYSSRDADSEGTEGEYYLWKPDEIRDVIGEERAGIVNHYFGVSANGNFEGRNILYAGERLQPEETDIIKQARASLLRAREKKIPPAWDDKRLASWNGLMLSGLAEAARVFNRSDYLKAAVANGSFLLESMMANGYLKHSYRLGKADIEGYLDDYSLVIEGLLNLHQATLSGRWLREAVRLTGTMIEEFWDESEGVFFDTGKRHQALFVRPRNIHDAATPSGSSAAVSAIMKVSRLIGNEELENIAAKSLNSVRDNISRYPPGFGNWLCAMDFHLSAPREIVLIGPGTSPLTAQLLDVLFNIWLPNKVMAAMDPDDPHRMDDLMLLENRPMIDNRPTVYICERYSCLTPVNDPVVLKKHLNAWYGRGTG
ncbi:MAG: thioredoxin domain-containing protein [Dehalococcoidales bacterium]|nr:thioredoxin domain-containing protein [Dehalococcoidales bacterium]